MNQHAVRITSDVAQRLAELAVEGESPNAVLRRLFGMPATQERTSSFKTKVLGHA